MTLGIKQEPPVTVTRKSKSFRENQLHTSIYKMMRLVVLAALVAVAVSASMPFDPELDVHWQRFTQTYNKQYKPDEANYRRLIWEKHLRYIQKHNLEADMGVHSFTLGMNQHADLTDDEFNLKMKGYKQSDKTTGGSTFMIPNNMEIPMEVDWRKKGYVTKIKDQEQCGSCWAFSTTGSLEGQHFKKTGKLVSLSEQELVDCSKPEGNQGCRGGLMDLGFNYIKAHGISTEASYPYTAMDGKCKRGTHRLVHGANCTGHVDIKRDSEMDLKAAASTVGPISVAIDASAPTFRFYKHGVYHSKKCSSVQLDHGVLVVGYGTMGDKAYWIVKNSWGESWGDMGYIMMSRNMKNNCGIATQASYPLV